MRQIAWSDDEARFVCERCGAHRVLNPSAVRTGEIVTCSVCGAVARAPRPPSRRQTYPPHAPASAHPGVSGLRRTLRRFIRDRRRHPAQRTAVDHLLERALGEPALMRPGRGSVYVYDDQRRSEPPRTVRALVHPDGEVEVDSFP